VLSSRPSDPSSRNDLCLTVNAQPVSSLVYSWSVQCRKRMRGSKVEYTPDRHLNKLLFANNSGFSTRPANDPSYLRSHMDLAAAVRHFRVEACRFNLWPGCMRPPWSTTCSSLIFTTSLYNMASQLGSLIRPLRRNTTWLHDLALH